MSSGRFEFIEINHYDDNLSESELDNIYGIYSDIHSLINDHILFQYVSENDRSGHPFDDEENVKNIGSIIPNDLRLNYIGREIYNILELDKIDEKDIEKIKVALNF